MIWKDCTLYIKKETGTDKLENPTYTDVEVLKTTCRESPWTNEEKALEGREVTENQQRLVVPLLFDKFPACDKAEVDGIRMDVNVTYDLSPRYTAVQVFVTKK